MECRLRGGRLRLALAFCAVCADERIAGGNLLARRNRRLEDGAALQAQGTCDRSSRSQSGNGGDLPDIYDLSAQDSLSRQARQRLAAWPLPASPSSLCGRNLLHERHVEYVNPPNTVEIGRSHLLDMRWRP